MTTSSGRRLSDEARPPRIDLEARSRQLRRRRLITAAVILGASVVALAVGLFLVFASRNTEARLLLEHVHVMGDPDAPVTMVEWADFQCPFCRLLAQGPAVELEKDLIANGTVKFAYRHMAFIGQESRQAAEASECAGDQGKFWEYYRKLFDNQGRENSGAFSDANLRRFAGELGLNTGDFDRCLDSGKYEELVADERDEARKLGIRSTPTYFINGRKYEGAPPAYVLLKAQIEAALTPTPEQ